ncbi:LysR family transcriptional regulator [Neorhizobium sp. DT-125]|uniref:LysR family transcriptional regulator n=1 Tax=Neorhizobium sp. DT-125 TaxID=3396163 RepID=UPI003F1AF31A
MRLLVSRHLENFLVTYETLNLHDAADLKGISQPALSKSLKLLEEEVGAPLFIRTSRGLEPTPAGDTLHKYARRLDQDARFASIDLQRSVDNLYGKMRIGIGPVLATTTFPKTIAEFHRQFPQISVTVETGVSSTLIAALDRDHLDVVVSALPEAPVPDSMVAMPLFTSEMVAIGRKSHPLADQVSTFEQVSAFGRVGFVEDREFERNAAKALGQRAEKVSPILQTTSLSVMFGMLAETDYYAIVSDLILPRALDSNLVKLRCKSRLWSITIGVVCKLPISESRAVVALKRALGERRG